MTQPTQTTSVDSIGSCSLDVNATGTTSPATMEALDGSRRSLRSVSLENNLTGATSPGVSTGTTPLRPILKPQPYTDPGSIKDPGGTADASYKTPSYLGISCAVNGYSRLNRYDSALRDGYRSRDASPARLAFSRSRDSSPMRPEWKIFDLRIRASPQETAAKIKELKEELARFRAEYPHPQPERGRQNSSRKLGIKPSQGRSISVDRGYLSKSDSKDMMNGHSNGNQVGSDVRLVEINMSDPNKVKSSSYQYSFEQSVVRDGVCESSESIHCSSRTNGETPQKSFIQSRIERLYGPSALGAGFRSRRSLLELEKEQRDRQSAGYSSPSSLVDSHYDPEEKAPEGFPSVFRHLRPEFRTQLQVKRNLRLQPALPLDAPLDTDSPKRPGRVIPITLTDTIEKPQSPSPPVLLPKPQNLINNKSKIENGFREGNGHQVIVKKIVNGNGNIKELEIPVVKESYVNGGIEEKENNVRIPKENSHRTCSIVNGVSGTVHVNGDVTSSSKAEKDGHHFLKVVDSVIASIEADVASVEPDLETFRSEMNEEVRGKVLSAIGKARLLISQKIQQFQGLCHKNIAGSIGEEFPTTCEDLAGFWDMVYIQVEDIRHLFKEIKALKANGWKEVPQDDLVDNGEGNVSTGRARKKPAPRPFRASKTTKAAIEKTEESKARDEARKKIMEERRRAMKEAMKAKKAETEAKQGDADSVEIYAPDCK
ncbi:Dlgap1p [Halocaridina rubra]|uniref:Dlgap1p n=1 Tax=Halocaridina rubra TaxID=373956 RepID=A0AAN8XJ39_HALRR